MAQLTITGDDVIVFHGDSISTDPRAWFNSAGSFLDRLAAANPGPQGGPYIVGRDSSPAKTIVSGNVGFQRGMLKTTQPPWCRVAASGQSILAMVPQGIMPYNPDVVFHETQANDEIQGPNGTGQITLSQYETAMRSYRDTLIAWKPTIRIFWINCWSTIEAYDLPLAWHAPGSTTFHAIDVQVCSETPNNMVLCDVNTWHLNLMPGASPPWPTILNPYTDDGVHPSDPVGKSAYCDGVMQFVRFQPP